MTAAAGGLTPKQIKNHNERSSGASDGERAARITELQDRVKALGAVLATHTEQIAAMMGSINKLLKVELP